MNMRSAFLIVFLAFSGSALSETGFERETLAANIPEGHSAAQAQLVAASDPIEQLGEGLKGIFRNIFGTGTTPSPTKQQPITDSPVSTSSTDTGAQGAASQANTERVLLRQYPSLSQLDPANYLDATFAEKIDTAPTGEAQPVKNLACAATVYAMLARGRGDRAATIDRFYRIGDGAVAPGYVEGQQPFDVTRVLGALQQQRPVVLVGQGGPLGSHYVLAVGFERTADRTVITALDPWPSTDAPTGGATISIDTNTRVHPRWDVTFDVMRITSGPDAATSVAPDSTDLLRRLEGRWMGKTSEGFTFEWVIDANGRYQTTFQRSGRPYRGGGTIWGDPNGEIQWKADGLLSRQSGTLVLGDEGIRPALLKGTISGTQITFEVRRVAARIAVRTMSPQQSEDGSRSPESRAPRTTPSRDADASPRSRPPFQLAQTGVGQSYAGGVTPSDEQAWEVVNSSLANLKKLGATVIDFRKLNGESLQREGQKIYIYHYLTAMELPAGIAWRHSDGVVPGGFTQDIGPNLFFHSESIPKGTTGVGRGPITFRLTERGWVSAPKPDFAQWAWCRPVRLAPEACYKVLGWDIPR